MTIHINLVCCTDVILNDLAQGCTRKGLALTYAMALKSAAQGADKPDWRAINTAILAKYKMSGLEWIKKRAWDIVKGRVVVL
jgi:hypothetical protein